jgi:hypothetical protein
MTVAVWCEETASFVIVDKDNNTQSLSNKPVSAFS